MSTSDTAGTAREGMTMSDETTRLRALLDGIAMPWKAQPTIVDGDEVECSALVLCPYGDDGDSTTVAEIDMGHDIECDDAHAALIVGAVNALPGLLDAAERAERAEARVRELEAIIAGRTTPPTDAEMRAHDVAGGSWLVWWGRESYTIAPAWLPYRRPGYGLKPWDLAQRWIALDADGRPCAWPTAEVSR